jgi:hypothetical protein
VASRFPKISTMLMMSSQTCNGKSAMIREKAKDQQHDGDAYDLSPSLRCGKDFLIGLLSDRFHLMLLLYHFFSDFFERFHSIKPIPCTPHTSVTFVSSRHSLSSQSVAFPAAISLPHPAPKRTRRAWLVLCRQPQAASLLDCGEHRKVLDMAQKALSFAPLNGTVEVDARLAHCVHIHPSIEKKL